MNEAQAAEALGPLDYVYAPSTDVAADVAWFVACLGAELVFAIDDGGTRVASLRVGTDGPPILLTDHLPDDRPIFLYRVADLEATSGSMRGRGWLAERDIELPMGPAITFRAPGGLRLGIYEPTRAFVVDGFAGRRDF
jgi:hypothetical protein